MKSNGPWQERKEKEGEGRKEEEGGGKEEERRRKGGGRRRKEEEKKKSEFWRGEKTGGGSSSFFLQRVLRGIIKHTLCLLDGETNRLTKCIDTIN